MRAIKVFLILAGVLAAFSAEAAEQIGVAVDAQTTVTRTAVTGGNQVVKTSTPVYLDDKLQANATGLAQIKLVDDTKIVVGPGSNVTLDDFVFSSSNSAKVVTVSVTKGAFRWISGRSGSKAYTIKTPSGSIGVRGTAFDVTIQGNNTDVLLLNGQVTVCPSGSQCREIRNRCEFVSFNEQGVIKKADLLKNDAIDQYKSSFPLLEDQQRLKSQFRRESAGCKGNALENTIRAIFRTIFVPPPPPVVVVVGPPPPPPLPGNPGNGGSMGSAGSNPSGRGFGNSVRGVSDLGPGGSGGGGNTSGAGGNTGGGSVSSTGSTTASATSTDSSVSVTSTDTGGGKVNGNAGGNGRGNAFGRN